MGLSLPTLGDQIAITGISRVEKMTLEDLGIVNGVAYLAGTTVYVPSVWGYEMLET